MYCRDLMTRQLGIVWSFHIKIIVVRFSFDVFLGALLPFLYVCVREWR